MRLVRRIITAENGRDLLEFLTLNVFVFCRLKV
jgi:hypothetical protein